MAYLIDGNNLIGSIPTLELGDPTSRNRLLARLEIFRKVEKNRIIVVFDGPPDLKTITNKKNPISVFYPDYDQNADAVIKELIKKETDMRRFFVVSSDREIQDFARLNKAKPINCADFNRLMKAAFKEYKNISELEKHEPTPSPYEVELWSDLFKEEK